MADAVVGTLWNSQLYVISFALATILIVIVFLLGRYRRNGSSNSDDEGEQDDKPRAKVATPKKKRSEKSDKQSNKRDQKVPYSHRWLLTTLKGHSGNVLNFDFSSNGKYLASCADGGALCWKSGNPCQSWRQSDVHQVNAKKNRQNALAPKTIISPKYYNGIRPPLSLYSALVIEGLELYKSLLTYVLSADERRRYGFPVECPNLPGKVEIISSSPSNPENPDERVCCRCRSKFQVTEEGGYLADDTCTYHWGKRKSVDTLAEDAYTLRKDTVFGCCDQPTDSPGCTRSRYHVSTRPEVGTSKFVKTRIKRLNGKGFGVYALDCEMCFTRQGLEVTKVTVVGPDGLTIYDSFVLPDNPIVDYNTNFSGITANDLKNVRTTLADVHGVLLKLFNSRSILIGHGLENDLKALHLLHENVIDTAVIFPHYYGLPFRRSLKSLINCYLQKSIQEDGYGHDSAEDARSCMELMLWKVLKDKHLGFKARKPHTANGS